jgi:RNA polymerase sigma factor (sigma-70 family)
MEKVLDYIHRTLAPPDGGLTDGQLLARFIASRDEMSFALLVRRHGPMVWRLCLRVLGHVQDAEDCFQAAFLVLACKAASVAKRESVGSFLYGVAYRTALDAKAINARRRSREKQVEDIPHPEVTPAGEWDWRHWLDLELSRLPEKYRTAVILCDLEGRTRKEAARQLKVPEGTLSSRLAMARRLLAKRLSRYGLSLSGAVLVGSAASAGVAASLVSSTTRAALGRAALSRSVDVLVKGALQTMLMVKLKLMAGALVVVTALGATGLVYRASGQSTPAVAERRPGGKPRSELDALRRENELLKLNLEVVLEKVRSQEAELRAFRSAAADAKKVGVGDTLQVIPLPEGAIKDVLKLRTDGKPPEAESMPPTNAAPRRVTAELHIELKGKPEKPDPLHEAEAALKALREARDTEAQRKAADALEKALQKLREQQKKQEGSAK